MEADVVANVDCEEYWGDWGECQMKDGEMQRCRTYEVKAAAEEGMECERGLGEECESEGCVMKTEMLAAPMVSPERPESVVPTKEAISLSLSGGSFIEVGPSLKLVLQEHLGTCQAPRGRNHVPSCPRRTRKSGNIWRARRARRWVPSRSVPQF